MTARLLVDLGTELVEVTKARAEDFGDRHEQQLRAVTYADRSLTFPHPIQRLGPGLTGVDLERSAMIGLRFTGLLKVRGFVDGYEWARFQWRRDRRGWPDAPLTGYLRLRLGGRYEHYRRHYGDVHERNVLFEVRHRRERGIRVLARDRSGRIRLVRVGLQPVDVR